MKGEMMMIRQTVALETPTETIVMKMDMVL